MSENRSRVGAARRVAYDVLEAVRVDDAYANLSLPAKTATAGLDHADAALATELAYGTLRMRGYYDRVIALAARRPVETIDPPILDVLRLGSHQLLATRIPPHAAVSESVALAHAVGSRSAVGFANGVLRAIARTQADVWRSRVEAAAEDDDDRLAALYSHPAWIVRAFRSALAAEHRGAELEALLDADNAAAQVNYALLPGTSALPDGAQPDRYSPIGFTLGGASPAEVLAATRGTRVQDEGSQLAALALVCQVAPAAGERWLDLCAGPGGKAAVLASAALAAGARLVANEVAPARAQLVREAIEPVAASTEVWQRDGIQIGREHPGAFDRVLLDAPCTGLGALRRRPEARWRKTPRDVAELSRLQSALIDSAVAALKPGGILCYVTCSPHLAETKVQVSDALKRHPHDLAELPTAETLAQLAREAPDLAGDPAQAQLWPHRTGTDAMFIALLQKTRPGGAEGDAG